MQGRWLCSSSLTIALAQAPLPLPTLDDKPLPQVDAHGPAAAVTALAFSADGETLYAAGLDKVVRVWTLQKNQFVLKATYRVPVGPGNMPARSTQSRCRRMAPAWQWPAERRCEGEAGFRLGGVIVETTALAAEQSLDAGTIYVASTANPAGGKVLRGHRGEVRRWPSPRQPTASRRCWCPLPASATGRGASAVCVCGT